MKFAATALFFAVTALGFQQQASAADMMIGQIDCSTTIENAQSLLREAEKETVANSHSRPSCSSLFKVLKAEEDISQYYKQCNFDKKRSGYFFKQTLDTAKKLIKYKCASR